MYALVDCNSFFCAVERVFHPGLKTKPVCVLSSNDGIIVALTPEAKALGLQRGDPLFKVKEIVNRNKVAVFSSNMQLYAAMSKRIVNILRDSVFSVENYSIDESFCNLRTYESHYKLDEYMRGVAQKIKLYTDIPVSVGIAPSKTLAKLGSRFAKKYKAYEAVCMIDSEAKRRKALELTPLGDIWGIGPRSQTKLNTLGLSTALQFADKSEQWVRSRFTKPGVQTWMELNGIDCISTAEVIRNQSICTSRSFGTMISNLDTLKASVANFASSCANKLRAQGSVAKVITVFVASNWFREDLEQYCNSSTIKLYTASSDTLELQSAALRCLERIYRLGVMYKRAGVILSDISSSEFIDQDVFDTISNRSERCSLMKAIDTLNHRYGLKTVHSSVEDSLSDSWKVKCDHRSKNYLTDINELLTIR